jgi:hypothetical protein
MCGKLSSCKPGIVKKKKRKKKCQVVEDSPSKLVNIVEAGIVSSLGKFCGHSKANRYDLTRQRKMLAKLQHTCDPAVTS